MMGTLVILTITFPFWFTFIVILILYNRGWRKGYKITKGKSFESSIDFQDSTKFDSITIVEDEKWQALIEIDEDIKKAINEIKPYGDKYVRLFKKKYMILMDKSYIGSIKDFVIKQHKADQNSKEIYRSANSNVNANSLNNDYEAISSEFLKSIRKLVSENNGYPAGLSVKATNINPYNGSGKDFQRGVQIELEDGSKLLLALPPSTLQLRVWYDSDL